MTNRNFALASFVAVALLGACGDDSGNTFMPGPVLTRSTATPADATCPAGGTKLDVGTDSNANGTLDDSEVSSTQVICSQNDVPRLTVVTPTGPSTKCPNGGTTVTSGPDSNANGTLDAAEVAMTDEICGGGGSVTLMRNTAVPLGDVICPFGGSKIDSGPDNGHMGGVAGDGILQDGEITSSSYACTSNAKFPGSFAPPAGNPGTNKVQLNGGAGTNGGGGLGGVLAAGIVPFGSNGGNVRLFRNGAVDASFTVPTETPQFGATKLDVAANLTLQTHADSTGAADGEYYTINNAGLFYRMNVGNAQIPVTGVHVAAGVTLTFPAGGIAFSITDDFHNEGTITATRTVGAGAPVNMTVGKYIGAAGSKIDLTGATNAGANAGAGGSLSINGDRVLSSTAVDTSGGNGDPGGAYNGGSGGAIAIAAGRTLTSGPIYCAGDVKSNGGTSKAQGGTPGAITLVGNTRGGGVRNITALPGIGGTNSGLGNIVIVLARLGELRVNGKIDVHGADVDAVTCAAACQGSNGAIVDLANLGGDLVANVTIDARGGKSKGMMGGNGAAVIFAAQDSPDPVLGSLRAAGNITVSAAVDARGGGGDSGGNGGGFQAIIQSNLPSGQQVNLYGFDSIDNSGGDGTTGGGNSQLVEVIAFPGQAGAPGSGIVMQPNVISRGGNTTVSGIGGSGGGLLVINQGTSQSKTEASLFLGTADLSGGNGIAGGGTSGAASFSGDVVEVNGAITANAGNATAGTSTGGVATGCTVAGQTAAFVRGALAWKGGNSSGATSTGGLCAGVNVSADAVTATAPISCGGGNGNGAAGGAGGAITITSGLVASSTAGLTAPAGTGTPNGAAGSITVDGNIL